MVLQNHRVTQKQLVEVVGISAGSVSHILNEISGAAFFNNGLAPRKKSNNQDNAPAPIAQIVVSKYELLQHPSCSQAPSDF